MDVLKSMRKMWIHLKGEERLSGTGDFLEEVLDHVPDRMDRRYRVRENRIVH
ncbi:MAG: hypothetical protein HY788_06605 [Deltaproteobacteria bacterium]|nr:hypothetical protein [Deltaproteobacteria bacterium]